MNFYDILFVNFLGSLVVIFSYRWFFCRAVISFFLPKEMFPSPFMFFPLLDSVFNQSIFGALRVHMEVMDLQSAKLRVKLELVMMDC